MLGDEVVDLLAGDAADDGWESVFHLLTADPDSYPRVCLLSRAELAADGDTVRCVLRARRTIANVRRDGNAVLVVVGGHSAHYVRLRARFLVEESGNGGGIAVAFTAGTDEEDTLGIPLRPMMFWASSDLRQRERSDDNRVLLGRLASAESDGGHDA